MIDLSNNIEYSMALKEKQIAESNFNNASTEYIEVAIHQYNAAIEKINLIIKRVKEGNCYEGNKFDL